MRARLPATATLATIALAACYSPQLDRCAVKCAGAGDPCPSDLTCAADHFCHADNDPPTCGSGGDGIDGPPGGPFTITVTFAGDGGGEVTDEAGGLDCIDDCSETIPADEAVSLDAAPDDASFFVGWSGDCDGDNPCTVLVDGDKAVIATFAQAAEVDVDFFGNGDGVVVSGPSGIDCDDAQVSTCGAIFAVGTQLTLTATPNPDDGSVFGAWGPPCDADGPTCVFVVAPGSNVIDLEFD